jgi:predicted dehydrogenase
VILHASTLMAANDLRFSVHGTHGSVIKQGLDTQEDALKAGRTPGDAMWGHDPRPGTLTTVDGDRTSTRLLAGEPGDYRLYYAAVRDAIRGIGPNPVTAADALAVMQLVELGMQSADERREVVLGH